MADNSAPAPAKDRLGGLQLGLTVTVGAATLFIAITVLLSLLGWSDTNYLRLLTQGPDLGSIRAPMFNDAGEIIGESVASPEADATLLMWDVATWLPTLVLATVLLWLLRRVVRHARTTEPFSATVVARLRTSSWVAIVGGVAVHAFQLFAEFKRNSYANAFTLAYANDWSVAKATTVINGGDWWQAMPHPDVRTVLLELPWAWILVGSAVLTIAAIINRGMAMRRDLDGLV